MWWHCGKLNRRIAVPQYKERIIVFGETISLKQKKIYFNIPNNNAYNLIITYII